MEHPEFAVDTCRLAGLHAATAEALAAYQRRNHERLRASMPARASEFFTTVHWALRIEAYRDEFRERRALRFILLDAAEVVGSITFDGVRRGALQACYLGYSLDGAYEGRGLMTRALRSAIDYAFAEFALHRIMANHAPGNLRSARLLARLGFEREGLARSYLQLDGSWHDHVLNSLVNPADPAPHAPLPRT